MKHKVVVIGAGAAGLACASTLNDLGIDVVLIEKESSLGGNLKNWHALFPERNSASPVLNQLISLVNNGVKVYSDSEVTEVRKTQNGFILDTDTTKNIECEAVVLATGFKPFEAYRKEEYGHGIYKNVLTSVELESMFDDQTLLSDSNGKEPEKIALVHCVGSRDEKAGNHYCSRVCCVTAVKQAIELKERFPHATVYCLYMDLRMFGRQYEELYREAQEKYKVQFIRGRLSEACENPDQTVLLKVEDTLAARQLRLSVNKLVLMVGMVPSPSTIKLGQMLELDFGSDRFINTANNHTESAVTRQPGIFVTGTCTGPASLPDVVAGGRSAALAVKKYLDNMNN
jgi:heterodisulfide reductase subunit A